MKNLPSSGLASKPATTTGHSAIVKLSLTLGKDGFGVRQLGPDFIMLRDRVDRPAGEGAIFLSVDGSERRWNIRLPEGISSEVERTPIETV